ncbi:uncharacterized protein BX663DRAFT_439890 [Cokeromyces recurvatus]|uniref:uncharacterized protein n=1 Tax=Cokeromyces recurvatus TaxID=90255 RepID=UPI00221EF2E2|nr:uncharacterized protein BX663DRAFT_441829 [Cokeromyces recurvatus]XP_051380189.1 uncharacterized protein BX663DRAFT_439890 [Cokeromyces recurvatus]KAI7899081.1 hypothetical protein BX663DRAFT_441829 [Cokeromyces recurvatus]KAI7900204.1 hypothetical protein BX663DRAFT_439890 [Cokeromyces recurvatus]
MKEHSHILQAKYIVRSCSLPTDALLTCLLPCINTLRSSQWRKLNNTALVKALPEPLDSLNTSTLR